MSWVAWVGQRTCHPLNRSCAWQWCCTGKPGGVGGKEGLGQCAAWGLPGKQRSLRTARTEQWRNNSSAEGREEGGVLPAGSTTFLGILRENAVLTTEQGASGLVFWEGNGWGSSLSRPATLSPSCPSCRPGESSLSLIFWLLPLLIPEQPLLNCAGHGAQRCTVRGGRLKAERGQRWAATRRKRQVYGGAVSAWRLVCVAVGSQIRGSLLWSNLDHFCLSGKDLWELWNTLGCTCWSMWCAWNAFSICFWEPFTQSSIEAPWGLRNHSLDWLLTWSCWGMAVAGWEANILPSQWLSC